MGFIGAFKTLGKGVVKVGRVLAKLDDIPGMSIVMTMIPVAGPVIAAAAKRVNMAEDLFDSGLGPRKKEWAKAQLAKDLRKLGVEEKYIDELVSVGLLVAMKHATVHAIEEEADEEKKEPREPERPAFRGPGRGRRKPPVAERVTPEK